jgi:hypothetical protein
MGEVQKPNNPSIITTGPLKIRDNDWSITQLLCGLLITEKLIQAAIFGSNLDQYTDYLDRLVFPGFFSVSSAKCNDITSD